jgi:hypothetical protein
MTDAAPNLAQWEELRTALLRLDLRLRLAVEGYRDLIVERARDPFRGLRVTDSDVDELLATTPTAEVAKQILASHAGASFRRLDRLAQLFHLNPFEQEALLICLAPELDVGYSRLYSYLQDDATRRRPTVDLIFRVLSASFATRLSARELFGPHGNLFRHQLLTPVEGTEEQQPLLSRALRVDARIVDYLLGSDHLDPRVEPFCELCVPESIPDELAPPEDMRDNLARLISRDAKNAMRGPVIYLHGASGAGKLAAIRTACQDSGCRLLVVDVPAVVGSGSPVSAFALLTREALLQEAVLALDGFERLLGDGPDLPVVRATLRRLFAERCAPTILIGEQRWEPAVWLPDVTTVRVEIPALGPAGRQRIWRSHVDGQLSPDEVGDLAARFRLDAGAIRTVASAARGRAIWRGDASISSDDVRAAARAIATPHLEGMARRVEPRYGWDDIVLPKEGTTQLREFCERARLRETVLDHWGFGEKHVRRRGLTALFAGPPGTGKTMAAEVVAGDLGLTLYRIDLSAVVSKYIGETEKNLERIFRAADQGDAVLLFDEADALFGKRSDVRDAHDRYANVEIAYLLQRLEDYDGVAVLTTNLRGNVDEAFVRRLDLVLEFAQPEEAERLAIWKRSIPPRAPLAEDVDLPFLARKFRLTGGHIRNIALAAAFLAASGRGPITMAHFVRATRREHQKMGKLLSVAEFEKYGEALKEIQEHRIG